MLYQRSASCQIQDVPVPRGIPVAQLKGEQNSVLRSKERNTLGKPGVGNSRDTKVVSSENDLTHFPF